MSNIDVQTGIEAALKTNLVRQIVMKASCYPILYMFLRNSYASLASLLAMPNQRTVLGGTALTPAKLKHIVGTMTRQLVMVTEENVDAKNVQHNEAGAVATKNFADLLKRGGIHWTYAEVPMQFWESDLENLAGGTDELMVYDNASAWTAKALVDKMADDLWNGTLTTAQQTETRDWANIMGAKHAHDDTTYTYYAGLERAVIAPLIPLTVDADADLPSDEICLGIIDYIKGGFTKTTAGTAVKGLTFQDPDGTGPTVWLVWPAGFHTLREEIGGTVQASTLVKGPMEKWFGGAKFQVIEYGDSIIMPDHNCPSGEMHGFCPQHITVEFQQTPTWGKEVKAHEVDQDSPRQRWKKLAMKWRVCYDRPYLEARVYGLSA